MLEVNKVNNLSEIVVASCKQTELQPNQPTNQPTNQPGI